jgi:hypothetical protein
MYCITRHKLNEPNRFITTPAAQTKSQHASCILAAADAAGIAVYTWIPFMWPPQLQGARYDSRSNSFLLSEHRLQECGHAYACCLLADINEASSGAEYFLALLSSSPAHSRGVVADATAVQIWHTAYCWLLPSWTACGDLAV